MSEGRVGGALSEAGGQGPGVSPACGRQNGARPQPRAGLRRRVVSGPQKQSEGSSGNQQGFCEERAVSQGCRREPSAPNSRWQPVNQAPGWDAGSGPRAGRVCLVCVGGERGNQAAFGVGAGGPPGACGAKGGIGACCLRVTGDLRSPHPPAQGSSRPPEDGLLQTHRAGAHLQREVPCPLPGRLDRGARGPGGPPCALAGPSDPQTPWQVG